MQEGAGWTGRSGLPVTSRPCVIALPLRWFPMATAVRDDANVEEHIEHAEGPSPELNRRILHAWAMLFLRDGYIATTMTAVAEEAHVGRRTLYRYFPDKEALLVMATARRHRVHIGAMLDAVGHARDGRHAFEVLADCIAEMQAEPGGCAVHGCTSAPWTTGPRAAREASVPVRSTGDRRG